MVAALALFALPPGARAQSVACTNGTIGRVDVVNHSVFSPDDLRGRAFAPVFRLVNRLHIRTRPSYIRRALFVREGSCYDAEAVTASARYLRDLNFVARAEATATRAADSTWTVRVETWDEWSLRGQPSVDSDNNYRYAGFSVTEDNLLGTGTFFAFWQERTLRVREERWAFGTTRVARTNTDASLSAGTTLTGRYARQSVSHPIRSELGRLGWDLRMEQEDGLMGWATGVRRGLTELFVPVRDRVGVANVVRRVGEPGRLRVIGAELRVLDRERAGPTSAVIDRDRASASAAADSFVARLGAQREPLGYVRIGGFVGVRRLRFTLGRGLDLITSQQNVALGHELTLGMGRFIGGDGRVGAGTYARALAFVSDTAGPWLGQLSVNGSVRLQDRAEPGDSPWRDAQLSAVARMYVGDRKDGWVTLYANSRVDLVANPELTTQLHLGTDARLRGYYGEHLPTGSAVSATVEPRINLPVIHPAVDAGFAFFADAGRGWASGVPFALNTGWRTDVGGALRLGFPAGTGSVMRIEWAWPLGAFPGLERTFRVLWTSTETAR